MKDRKGQIEALMLLLGERGKFQIVIHLLLAFTYMMIIFNHVLMAFFGAPIKHECMPNAGEIQTKAFDTVVLGDGASSLPYSLGNVTQQEEPQMTYGSCSSVVHLENGENRTVVCGEGQWKYSPKYGEKNIVSEFDLVCSDKSLASLATTIYFAGVMVGGLVFGDLADRFGRLPIMIVCIYSSSIVGLVTAFAVNYQMFVVLRFFNGILIQGLQTSAYTMIMELFLAKHRPYGGAVAEMFFATGVMVLAGLAYFLKDWRHLQIAISLIGALPFFYACVVPESLRWLITKRKMDKAEVLIRKICHTNKIIYPAETVELLKQDEDGPDSSSGPVHYYNVTHLFRTPKLRTRTLVLSFLWLVISTCYYGVTFKMARFKVNRYMLFFIGGAVEGVVYIASIPIMNIFGRKKPLFLAFVIGGVMSITSGLISDHTVGLDQLTAIIALVGRCAMALLFGIIFVYTSELYPTVIRNIGMGFCCFWARVGGVLAPQINQWGRDAVGFDAIIVFGVLSLLAAIVLLLLEETHNTKLADSIDDVEERKQLSREVVLKDSDPNNVEDQEPCLKAGTDTEDKV